jgi:16S rRNA (cytosine1402-N4)-methyltransferase
MWRECVDGLIGHFPSDRQSPLIIVDGTLGGGGHSEALLRALQPGDIVFGCDVDPQALDAASTRLQEYMVQSTDKPRFVPVCSNFSKLQNVISAHAHPTTNEAICSVDGILLDLGVSSHQIDCAERGFAFMQEGPLDMRMNNQNGGITAANICNEFDAKEILRILQVYGDEPRAKKIAEAIISQRPLQTTTDLVNAVSEVTPQFAKSRRMGRTATLARVFQSLRIVVNREDKVLEAALLQMAPALLRPGGRLAVLSYHSIEDRATKRAMRDGSMESNIRHEKDMYGNDVSSRPFKTTGKARKASDEEVEHNSRARSATLRIAERQ